MFVFLLCAPQRSLRLCVIFFRVFPVNCKLSTVNSPKTRRQGSPCGSLRAVLQPSALPCPSTPCGLSHPQNPPTALQKTSLRPPARWSKSSPAALETARNPPASSTPGPSPANSPPACTQLGQVSVPRHRGSRSIAG